MKLVTRGIPESQMPAVHAAIQMVDSLVWGGTLKRKVRTLKIFKDSFGTPSDPEIFRGLIDVYNPRTKTCELHIASLIEMGDPGDSNTSWSICHDLAHAFDVYHGNLSFDRRKGTICYMGKDYVFQKKANTSLPESYLSKRNLRENVYYQAHDYYEPWEVRPLMAADACMAETRRGNDCPNLVLTNS